MRLEERRVAVRDLLTGMYVCRLDREANWEGTPFSLQGVMVQSHEDIAQLAEHAQHVYVDIELGLVPYEPPKPVRQRTSRNHVTSEIEQMRDRVAYSDTASFDEELPRARDAQLRTAAFASRMLDDVRAGRPISPVDVREAVEPMVCSILRNADAFLWLEHLRERGSYEYNHALNCSALSAAFGRHIGFPEDLLTDMASGGLLLDIGKLRVREELITRNGSLNAQEMEEVKQHVEHALEILDSGEAVPTHIREMVCNHHEREDGSGYPRGLPGDQIPLLGRIAAVIDSYDAMINDRHHCKGVSKHAALQTLYRERDRVYTAEIVEQFMQCMSVYPTGSLVELSTGEVAVVMGQNSARKLRPRVMVLTASDKTLLPAFRTLDLMMQEPGDRESVVIVETLPADAFGLDTAELFL